MDSLVNFMNKCRSCQSTNLSLVHDFGLLPDAGDFQPLQIQVRPYR